MKTPQLFMYVHMTFIIEKFLSKIRKKGRLTSLTFLFNIVVKVLPREIGQEKRYQDMWPGREEVKFSLLTVDII